MNKKEIVFGLLIAILLAVFLSPFASPWPDGLEKVAEDKGFIEKGEAEPFISSPIADYIWPNIKSEKLATSYAGILGTLIMFILGYGIGSSIRRKS